MARCQGTKGDGSPCERIVPESIPYCYSHDPARAEERREHASKAGKSKGPGAEVVEIKATLRLLMHDVVEGRADKGRVSVAAQVAGVLCRYHELERRIKETEELERRIEELERMETRGGGGALGW